MKIFSCKRLLLGLVSLLTLMFVLGGVGAPPAMAKDPVKLGLLSPFSPPGDPAAGKRLRWGAELAI
jgi:hypothetical protein